MRFVFAIAIFTICAIAAESKQPPETRPATDLPATEVLPFPRQVLQNSGTIFSGTVLRVQHRNADSSSALATTRVVFRVDEAIRNVHRGQTIEINEWAGLWQAGERYHPGERVLLFLYPPSKLGLTSPVGNGVGRFGVNRIGKVTFKGPIGQPPRAIEIRRVISAIRQAEEE